MTESLAARAIAGTVNSSTGGLAPRAMAFVLGWTCASILGGLAAERAPMEAAWSPASECGGPPGEASSGQSSGQRSSRSDGSASSRSPAPSPTGGLARPLPPDRRPRSCTLETEPIPSGVGPRELGRLPDVGPARAFTAADALWRLGWTRGTRPPDPAFFESLPGLGEVLSARIVDYLRLEGRAREAAFGRARAPGCSGTAPPAPPANPPPCPAQTRRLPRGRGASAPSPSHGRVRGDRFPARPRVHSPTLSTPRANRCRLLPPI